ncbi:MAG: HEAT repeat domain-containing protein [Desulfobacterales bacterium]|nr:HEAT repeat domain-containing protein [Desulfobacterales bacterium]
MNTASFIEPKIEKILSGVKQTIEQGMQKQSDVTWAFAVCEYDRFAEDLAKLGRDAVKGLITYARGTNLDRRICILMALGKIGSNAATDYFIEALQSNVMLEREYAAIGLEKVADPNALEELKKAIETETQIRGSLYRAIIAIADDSTKTLFMKALEDESPEIRRTAISHFAQTPGDDVLHILLKALHDKQMGVVYGAVRGLKLYGESIVDDLIEKTTAKGTYVRAAAVQLLGDIKSDKAVEPLCQLLQQSNNKALRADIALSLGKIKSPVAVKFLCKALKDPDSKVRANAAEALGQIGSPDATYDLEASLYLEGFDYNGLVGNQATIALGKIKTPFSTKALIKALQHKDGEVRRHAADGLKKHKAIDAIPAIEEALSHEKHDSHRKIMENVLFQLKKSKAVADRNKPKDKKVSTSDDAAVQLKSEDPTIRKKAIAVIKKKGLPEEVSAIEPLLFDDDAQVRKEAAEAIKAIDPHRTVIDSKNQLEAADGTKLPYMIEALGIMGDDSSIEPLLPFLADRRPHIRSVTKAALKRLKISDHLLKRAVFDVQINDYLHKGNYGKIIKTGADAIAILRKIMVDMAHPLQMNAAFALYRLDWEPETLEEKICYFARISDQAQLDAIAQEGVGTLKQLFIKGEHPGPIAKALASTGAEGITFIIEENRRFVDPVGHNPVVEALLEHGRNHVDLMLEYFEGDTSRQQTKGYLAHVLGAFGTSKAVQLIMEFLEDALKETTPSDNINYFAAAKALGTIGDSRAVPLLIKALKSKHPWRRGAASALGDIGSKEAVFVLRDAVKQDDVSVKNLAAAALKQIGVEPDIDQSGS